MRKIALILVCFPMLMFAQKWDLFNTDNGYVYYDGERLTSATFTSYSNYYAVDDIVFYQDYCKIPSWLSKRYYKTDSVDVLELKSGVKLSFDLNVGNLDSFVVEGSNWGFKSIIFDTIINERHFEELLEIRFSGNRILVDSLVGLIEFNSIRAMYDSEIESKKYEFYNWRTDSTSIYSIHDFYNWGIGDVYETEYRFSSLNSQTNSISGTYIGTRYEVLDSSKNKNSVSFKLKWKKYSNFTLTEDTSWVTYFVKDLPFNRYLPDEWRDYDEEYFRVSTDVNGDIIHVKGTSYFGGSLTCADQIPDQYGYTCTNEYGCGYYDMDGWFQWSNSFKVTYLERGDNVWGTEIDFNSLPIGINELESNLDVYPIPFNDQLIIDGFNSFKYSLSNVNGQIVQSGENLNNTIKTDQIKRGVYILKIESEGKYYTKRVIK